jgi:hypothetical protein
VGCTDRRCGQCFLAKQGVRCAAAVGRIDREICIACGAGIGFVELELKSREQTVNADGEVLPTRALGDLAVELSF